MVARVMQRFHRVFLCLLLITLLPTVALSGVKATIDRNEMVIDETLSLSLVKDGTSLFTGPDLKPLEKDFKVIGQSTRSSSQIINGSTTSSTQWDITLAPLRTGKLEIPSIEIGKDKTNPLTILVNKADQPKTKADNAPIFIETDVNTQSTYVQSQIIVSLRIYWAMESRINEPTDPDIPDALIKRLGDSTFDKRINGRRYKVFERKYAIFPQKSGSMEIPPFVIDVQVPSRNRSANFYDPFGTRMENIKLRSESETIQIQEKPASYPDSAVWLPASMVNVREQWSNSYKNLKVGESTTITISLVADGLMGEQLPPIELHETQGLKYYQGKAEVDNTEANDGIIGTRKESIALIPIQAGEYELPEIRIPWWNIKTEKIEYAHIPAKKITVTESPANNLVKQTPEAPGLQQGEKENALATLQQQTNQTFWIITCSVLGAGWLLTLYLLINTHRKINIQRNEIKQKQLEEALLKEKQAFNKLCRACRKNEPGKARKALVTWINTLHPHTNIQTLSDIEQAAPDSDILAQMHQLDRTLYDPNNSSENWNGKDLLELIKKIRAEKTEKTKNKRNQLEELYK